MSLTNELLAAGAAATIAPFLYRWADRTVGAGGEKVLGPLGGRSIGFLGGGVLGAGLGYLAAGPWGAAIGLFWAPYRSLDFQRGAAVPINDRQRRNAYLRHILAILAAVPVWLLGGPWELTALAMAVYALRAYWLAEMLGRQLLWAQETNRPWDDEWNNRVERDRGFAYGLAAGAVWTIPALVGAFQ